MPGKPDRTPCTVRMIDGDFNGWLKTVVLAAKLVAINRAESAKKKG